MFALPVWWALLFAVGTLVAGPAVGGGVVALAVLTMAIRLLLVRWSNPPHPVE
jgi:hypothetical protein